MTAIGIIKKIDNNRAKIEVYGDNTGCSTCSTGNCASCSSGKSRTYTAKNSRNLPLKEGILVEINLSSIKAVISLFRVIVMPLTLFALLYYSSGKLNISGGYRLIAGFTGLAAGFSVNFLIPEKLKEREMPEIVRVI